MLNDNCLSQSQIIKEWENVENQINSTGDAPMGNCHKNSILKEKIISAKNYYFETPMGKAQSSVISLSDLYRVFDFIKDSNEIEFDFVYSGCEARAHKMAKILESIGIVSAKVFIHSQTRDEKLLRITKDGEEIFWESHVAPVIKVSTGKKVIKQVKSGWFSTDEVLVDEVIDMVIDPAVSNKPLTLENWKKLIVNKKSKAESFITSRFNFFTADKYEKRNSYNEANEFHMMSGLDLGHQCIADKKNNIYNEKCDYSHLNTK